MGSRAGQSAVALAALAALFASAAMTPVSGSPSLLPPPAAAPVALPYAEPDLDVLAPPSGATVELFPKIRDGDSLADLLGDAGVDKASTAEASKLVADALPGGIPAGTEVDLLLGPAGGKGQLRLERLSLQASPALKLLVGRTAQGELRLVRQGLAADATPGHYEGRAGSGLFWSLRSAGVPADTARDFLDALSKRVAPASVHPDDRFQLVVEQARDASGQSHPGKLLYAALDRGDNGRVELVRWTVDGQSGWFDPDSAVQRLNGFERPVPGAVTSPFGYRVHPILRIARMHDGVDLHASWGTPVVAAADGVVEATSWRGGYGRQVRLGHGDSVETSYSHLSSYAVAPGSFVRRGQVIGYVGSSGFSTGPHLHFEVRKSGAPVDPLSFQQPSLARIASGDLAALRARAEQLRSL